MKAGFCSFSHCAVLWCTQIIGYVIAQWLFFVCLLFMLPHHHHYAGRRIWKYWTSKIVVRYIRSSVCIKSSQFSQLYFMQYMGLFVYSACQFLLWWLWGYMYLILFSSSNRKHGPLLLFRVRSWNSSMRCMSFYFLIGIHNGRLHYQGKTKQKIAKSVIHSKGYIIVQICSRKSIPHWRF